MVAPVPHLDTLGERYSFDNSCPKFAHHDRHLKAVERARPGFPVLPRLADVAERQIRKDALHYRGRGVNG